MLRKTVLLFSPFLLLSFCSALKAENDIKCIILNQVYLCAIDEDPKTQTSEENEVRIATFSIIEVVRNLLSPMPTNTNVNTSKKINTTVTTQKITHLPNR